jgi:HEAT repeat protein
MHRWLIGAMLVGLLLAGMLQVAWAAPHAGFSQSPLAQSDYPGLDNPDPAVRAETVQVIRKAQDADAVPALLAHLEDPDQRTGLYIAQALVELAPPDAMALLQRHVFSDNPDGRWRAAFVLGERLDPRATSVLARALHDDEVLVTRTAAEALAKIGTPGAISALITSLGSPRPSEAHAAMNGLLFLGDAAVPALAQIMEAGERQAEYRAATVLEAIGTPLALKNLNYVAAQ